MQVKVQKKRNVMFSCTYPTHEEVAEANINTLWWGSPIPSALKIVSTHSLSNNDMFMNIREHNFPKSKFLQEHKFTPNEDKGIIVSKREIHAY